MAIWSSRPSRSSRVRRPLRVLVVAVLAGLASAVAPPVSADVVAPELAHGGTTAAQLAGAPVPDGPISGHVVPRPRGQAAPPVADPRTIGRLGTRGVDIDQPIGTMDIAPWTGEIHVMWGVAPSILSDGMQATHTINTHIAVSRDWIYAPTMVPNAWSTIEISTIYSPDGNAIGAWDWGSGTEGWGRWQPVDADLLGTYTTAFNGLPAYTVRIVRTDLVSNRWTAYLYNYRTRSWDMFYTRADPSKLGGDSPHTGWNAFEVYANYNPGSGQAYYCTETYGSLWWSAGIRIKFNGNWTLLIPGNSTVGAMSGGMSLDFGCYSLSFALQSPNNTWLVSH